MDIYEIINEAVKYDRTVSYSINADGFMIHGGVIDMSSCIEFNDGVEIATEDGETQIFVKNVLQFNGDDAGDGIIMYSSGMLNIVVC